MAVNVEPTKVSSDLSIIVTGAISTVKKTRSTEQARKEAEFQRAIADGMSYEDQIAFRENQLKSENESSFGDPEYITKLEKSIADTKKLSRFSKYRNRYAELLAELSSGKINEERYLGELRNQISGVVDPDLRLEIQTDITEATGKVKQYQDTILANQVKKAKYDGTQSALNDAVSRVSSARMQAVINENDDEVTAYDETLSALNAQLSAVRVQDSITDFQVRSSTRGVNPVEKLDFINNQIQSADANVAIKIGDRTFTSAQQFWTLERDNFLAGSSQIFGNFFDELKTTADNAIASNVAKFGYPTQSILDSTLNTFNEIRSKAEVQPFIAKLDVTQANVMSEAVDKIANVINAVGTNNLTFKEADAQLQNIGKKYGIDVASYRLQLDENVRNLARGGVLDEREAANLAPDVNVELPKVGEVPKEPAVTPTTPAAPSVAPTGLRTVRAGENLSLIAQQEGVSLQQLIEANPEYKTNPDLVREGAELKIPKPTVTTPTTPTEEPKPTPAPTTTPPSEPVRPTQPPIASTTPAVPVTPTATPAPQPQPTEQKTAYTGSSIVDYLKSVGQDSSFESRKKLAEEKGITGYTGSGEQNTKLLNLLRG